MKRGSRIKQHDLTDCGAACLVSVAIYYGRHATIAGVRRTAGTNRNGTTLAGLSRAAEKLGFECRGVRATWSALSHIPLPAIAHLSKANGLQHYVVLQKIKRNRVVVMDPQHGSCESLPKETFLKEWTGVLLLLTPGPDYRDSGRSRSLISRLLPLLRPHRGVLLQALLGAALYTVTGLATAIYVQILVDHVLQGDNHNLLRLAGFAMVAIVLLRIWLGALQNLFVLKTGQLIDCRLLLDYYNHLLKLPHAFFDSMRTGEILSRLNDAVKIRTFINDAALQLAVNLFVILFSFLLLFTIYWKLGLFLLFAIPAWALVYLIINRLNRQTQRVVMEESANTESQLVESLRNISTIKQLGLEEAAGRKTEYRMVRLLKSLYRSGLNALFAGSATDLISSMLPVLTLWAGAWAVIGESLTIGELLSFYSVIGYFTGPVSETVTMNRTFQDASIAGERLFEIMDLKPERRDEGLRLQPPPDSCPVVSFRDVSFSYEPGTPVLNRFTMTARPGSITALVGPSGCGKSTVFKILQGLYPAEQGEIRINNIRLGMIAPSSLRSYIGIVPQQVELFGDSLLENIAAGDDTPDPECIWNICERLGMAPLIESLPDGLHTRLGENGVRLSGGQKQRVAIARALYRNPSVLLMDEATSSLDSFSERLVKVCTGELAARGVTVLLIAHRLATARIADQICYMASGTILEQGTHSDLIRREGDYCRLWNEQSGILV